MLHPTARRFFAIATCLILTFSPSTAAARDGETDHLEAEAKDLADWLIQSQRAGWEQHNVEEYLTQWHPDSLLVIGRGDQPSEHDLTVPRDRLEATRRLRMHGQPSGSTLAMSDIEVQINDGRATVTWRCISTSRDETYRELMREHYQLTMTEEGWKVTENRTWFLGVEKDGTKKAFTEMYWQRQDAIATELKRAGRPRQLRAFLFDGYQFAEAYDAAVQATELDDATPDDWIWRGITAAIAYRPVDAKIAFKKAVELDPDTWLPAYAAGSDWIDEE